jgi:hypothetical protein
MLYLQVGITPSGYILMRCVGVSDGKRFVLWN